MPPRDRLKKFKTSRLIMEKLPFLFLAMGNATVTMIAQNQRGAIKDAGMIGWTNISNALVAYAEYLAKMVWPGHLVVLYPYVPQPIWKGAVAGLIMCTISTSVWIWRSKRYFVTGWLWYIVTLLPVSGLIRIGEHSFADRYGYIPLIGPFVAISWWIWEKMAEKRKFVRKLTLTAIVVILLLFSVKTWNQIPLWQDSITLFRHTIEFTNNNWMAYHNIGTALIDRGETEEGLIWIDKSLQINPDYSVAYNSLAIAYGRLGYEEKAITALKYALSLDPGFKDARYNLVRAYIQEGQKEAAFVEYQILQKSDRYLADKLAPYF